MPVKKPVPPPPVDLLADLEFQFLRHRRVAGALAACRKARTCRGDGKLRRALRSRPECGGRRSDARLRRGFDDLLAFYGLVEVALRCGLLPRGVPARFKRKALRVLELEDVRFYYEFRAPLVLPRLLRIRLQGPADLDGGSSGPPPMANLFQKLLDTSSLVERDRGVEAFHRLLSEERLGSKTLDDWIRLLAGPRRFWKHLLRKDGDQRPLDVALHGFRTFLTFACELGLLLERQELPEPLKSAFWHHHARWFDHLGERLNHKLRVALEQFEGWPEPGETAGTDEGDGRINVAAAVRRLTSGRYGWALRESTWA